MPPLKHLKHEQFVKNFVKSSSATEAYLNTYPSSSEVSAMSSACDLLSSPKIQNRLLEVFEEQGISDGYITTGLKALIDNDPKGSVKLGAIRTVLEVRKDIESANKIGIQVNISEGERKSKMDLLVRMIQKNSEASKK